MKSLKKLVLGLSLLGALAGEVSASTILDGQAEAAMGRASVAGRARIAAKYGLVGPAGATAAEIDAIEVGARDHATAVADVEAVLGVGGTGSLHAQTKGLLDDLKTKLLEKRSKSIVDFIGLCIKREHEERDTDGNSAEMGELLSALRAIHPEATFETFYTSTGVEQTSEPALATKGAIQATVLNLLCEGSDLPEGLKARLDAISTAGKRFGHPEYHLAQLRDRTRVAVSASTLVEFLRIEAML